MNVVFLFEGVMCFFVNDGFGDVFGIYYVVIVSGYMDVEIYELLIFLCCELLIVDGVVDVNFFGVLDEIIYVYLDLVLIVN